MYHYDTAHGSTWKYRGRWHYRVRFQVHLCPVPCCEYQVTSPFPRKHSYIAIQLCTACCVGNIPSVSSNYQGWVPSGLLWGFRKWTAEYLMVVYSINITTITLCNILLFIIALHLLAEGKETLAFIKNQIIL